MARPDSDSHRIAVMKQDNGELQQDVVERDLAEAGSRAPGRMDRRSAADVDRESAASFPASDPPSSWAGPAQGPAPADDSIRGTPTADATLGEPAAGRAAGGRAPGPDVPPGDRAEGPAGGSGRVVAGGPAPEAPERQHPADPVPGTLRRDRG